MDSVFIFQSAAEEIANASYDAIVVEQWTVVDVGLLSFECSGEDVHFEKPFCALGLKPFSVDIMLRGEM